MIGPLSIALACWEAFALITGRPTITTLSTLPGTRPLIYAWWLALGIHLALESRKS